MLYSSFQTDLTSTFRRYTSPTYKGTRYTINEIVYVRNPHNMEPRPALLHYFAAHAIYLCGGTSSRQHVLASVSWLRNNHAKDCFCKPLELWWKDLFEHELDSVIPLQYIVCHSVYREVEHKEQTVFLLTPV